jgi:hypothetical protein
MALKPARPVRPLEALLLVQLELTSRGWRNFSYLVAVGRVYLPRIDPNLPRRTSHRQTRNWSMASTYYLRAT